MSRVRLEGSVHFETRLLYALVVAAPLRVSLGAALASLLCCSDGPPPSVNPLPSHPLPYRTGPGTIERFADPGYETLFVRGVNLGVGIPGTQPGQLAPSRDQYSRWMKRMGEIGFNVLRVYTLHLPHFYEEFLRYNTDHPDHPLYLMQGIWLDEHNPSGDIYDQTELYHQEIDHVVDAIHGEAEIPQRYGKAFGQFNVDVSPWVLAWVVGREVMPWEVALTNRIHPDDANFEGLHVRAPGSTPFESWIAASMDRVVDRERTRYGVDRPVSFSSWPTLDPLVHPIEGPNSDEDKEKVDLANIDLFDAPGGFFKIFHAYPYYPDFMVETPEFADVEDAWGRNSYLGYLHALVEHYGDIPVVIGEFGVPTSWGNAHYGQNGMHHGGHDEALAGFYMGRMFHNIRDAKTAGGVAFAWMDEWWKRTWITDELDFPRNRRFLWHNVTAAEQNFGLLAFGLGEPSFVELARPPRGGAVTAVFVAADASFFHLRLELTQPFESTDRLEIGFDTYRDDLGESVLPSGTATGVRSESALVIDGLENAQLYVTEAYDSYGIWHGTGGAQQRFHSIATDGAPWVPVRWKNNGTHVDSTESRRFPETLTEIGRLGIRRSEEPASNLDAIVISDTDMHIRVPWTLLQVTDPSRLTVLDDDRATTGRETAVSEGIRVVIEKQNQRIETPRYRWKGWEKAPMTVEREKAGVVVMQQMMLELGPQGPSP